MITHFLNRIGFISGEEFIDSLFGARFSFYPFLGFIIGGGLSLFVKSYIWADPSAFYFLQLLMLVDLITGVIKAKMTKTFRSRSLPRVAGTMIAYALLMFIAFHLNRFSPVTYFWLPGALYGIFTATTVWSIIENLHAMKLISAEQFITLKEKLKLKSNNDNNPTPPAVVVILFLMLIGFSSCVTQKRCERKFPPAVSVKETIVLKDTTIYIPAAAVSGTFDCDSLFKILKFTDSTGTIEVSVSPVKRSLGYARDDKKIKVEARYTPKPVTITTRSTERSESKVSKPIREKYIPFWVKMVVVIQLVLIVILSALSSFLFIKSTLRF